MRVKQHGFSLTELMVATTLLTTIMAGGIAAFARAQATRRDAGFVQQQHERMQYAFASLEPDLQMAGFFGAGVPGALALQTIPESARACGAAMLQNLDVAIEVMENWQLACQPHSGGAMPGSQILIVRRASALIAHAAEAGRAQWFIDATAARAGQVYWEGEAPTHSADSQGSELRDLLVHIYYVARRADGDDNTPALRVKSLTRIAGRPAFLDTEVMPGVDQLQAQLLPTNVAARAVRVQLRMRPDAQDLRSAPAAALPVARTYALRNAR